MGKYDFDKVIDRTNTDSVKWDGRNANGIGDDVLPMWVADMDFETLPEVRDAIVERAKTGVYGYCIPADGHDEAVAAWMESRHNWRIEKGWIVQVPGVVFAFSTALCAMTKPGDAVMLQSPTYGPFFSAIRENDRELVDNPLRLEDGRYTIDFNDFEKKIADHDVKLLMLCSPHNPTGRVWTEEELRKMAALCEKYGVKVIADEIHHDLVYMPYVHMPFANINAWTAENTVTCTAPSKTFNLAGLDHANTIIANAELREAYRHALAGQGQSSHATFGSLACREAYLYGAKWLDELLAYLAVNFEMLRERLEKDMPRIKLIRGEGLYLAWLDMRDLAFEEGGESRFLLEEARLWFNDGSAFGGQGKGFVRMNLACPHSTVKEALERLANAYKRAGF